MNNRIEAKVYETCIGDRRKLASLGQNSFLRRCCLDLVIKYFILLLNSVGRRRAKSIVFVDEVNNSNMYNNLAITRASVSTIEATSVICFRKRMGEGHVKTGILWTVCEMIYAALALIPPIMRFALSNQNVNTLVIKSLILRVDRYLSKVDESIDTLVLVSDHHFFSTVLSCRPSQTSYVLQHGLIQDPSFYTPIRADYFLAWGKRSAGLVSPADKVLITGTLKYAQARKREGVLAFQDGAFPLRVLLCLSTSRTSSEIVKRLNPVFKLQDLYGFELALKIHPGSLYSIDEAKRAAGNRPLSMYKEEPLGDIEFDFAITEQSTAVVDFAYMGIPFIIFDDGAFDYFFPYRDSVPWAKTYDDLKSLFESLDGFDYEKLFQMLLHEELNDSSSRIVDTITRFDGARILRQADERRVYD